MLFRVLNPNVWCSSVLFHRFRCVMDPSKNPAKHATLPKTLPKMADIPSSVHNEIGPFHGYERQSESMLTSASLRSIRSYAIYRAHPMGMWFSDQDHCVVKTACPRSKGCFKAGGHTLTDFAKSTPFAVSDLQLTKQNSDLVVSGPFSEPDSFFLRRQARAYGAD